MASAFGHAVAAFTLIQSGKSQFKLMILALLSAILPDADVIGFCFGIPYGSPLGHRGFTHSILFALLWALFLSLLFFKKKWARNFWTLFLVTVSHGTLDAMTTGGKGVGFFIPFENSRYFFPFRPIEVSPLRIGRFWDQAQHILWNEMIWIGIPCFLILGINRIFRKN